MLRSQLFYTLNVNKYTNFVKNVVQIKERNKSVVHNVKLVDMVCSREAGGRRCALRCLSRMLVLKAGCS